MVEQILLENGDITVLHVNEEIYVIVEIKDVLKHTSVVLHWKKTGLNYLV